MQVLVLPAPHPRQQREHLSGNTSGFRDLRRFVKSFNLSLLLSLCVVSEGQPKLQTLFLFLVHCWIVAFALHLVVEGDRAGAVVGSTYAQFLVTSATKPCPFVDRGQQANNRVSVEQAEREKTHSFAPFQHNQYSLLLHWFLGVGRNQVAERL
jgi:hypothetical protein